MALSRSVDRPGSWIALLVAGFLMAGCSAGASTVPTARTPATQTSPPSADASATTDLVARVLVCPDVIPGLRPWPSISVYTDGRVIGPEGLRRLTPAGVDAVRATFTATGFFTTSREIPAQPSPSPVARGVDEYTATLRVDGRLVTVSTTNLAPSPEGLRFIAATERLSKPETWLPAEAWKPGWSTPRPYRPDRWFLQVTLADATSGWEVPSAPDIGAIDWPFEQPPTRFGSEYVVAAPGGVTVRCGIAFDAPVQRLVASLRTRGVGAEAPDYLSVSLRWAEGGGSARLWLEPALPDDVTCPEWR